METICVQVPEGKKAEQTTDSEGNITIKFVEKEDKNPFKKGLNNSNKKDLESFCEKAFGRKYAIELTFGSEPAGRIDLINRSLVVTGYDVILHKCPFTSAATVIEFITK